MLGDNIRIHRKKNNMSQDDLAEKLGVSRQSISLWETGQTQPTIDNIVALSKIFNISLDTLLVDTQGVITDDKDPEQNIISDNNGKNSKKSKKSKAAIIAAVVAALAVLVGVLILPLSLNRHNATSDTDNILGEISVSTDAPVSSRTDSQNQDNESQADTKQTTAADTSDTDAPVDVPFDLFAYCRDLAINIGNTNGDYCIYQQPAEMYGGYEGEYFSISYWADSDMVEFCLHCPLSETQSHNFYLRMRGGYDGKYEYVSSKYYRDTGASFREAMGYIDPTVFYDGYPIPCDEYSGSTDGQTEFMEQTRVGMCDLIRALKKFVDVEKMDCDFSVFGFANF